MKRILSIIVVSTVLTVAFTALKFAVYGRVLPKANFGMRALFSSEEVSDLYIGSSVFRQGINAPEISEKSFLLAYNGHKPCHEAMQLKNLLEHGARFERLIVDMYPYSLVRDTEISDVRLLMDADLPFTFALWNALPKASRTFTKLYDMVVLRNNEILATFPVSYPLINARSARGSNTSVIHGRTADEIMQIKKRTRVESDSDFKKEQLEGLEEIIRLCRDNHIELVFLETPKYRSLYEDGIYQRLMREYSRLLTDRKIPVILNSYTHSLFANALDESLIQTYDFQIDYAPHFIDEYHVSYEGRIIFTGIVKDLLKKLYL